MPVFAFGPFELDSDSRRLMRASERLTIPDRHLSVLLHLVANAGSIASKDVLIAAAWVDVAVTDNSLEQVISALRRLLGEDAQGHPYVETMPRRGYRFAGEVTRVARRQTDESLDSLLAPHRAWIEGRAALETLERDQIVRARDVFEGVVSSVPDQAWAHIGLANACVMQFEMTRADRTPDRAALAKAELHAREACRLDSQYGEAWATLGFVLARTGQHVDGVAASRRAVALEPDNWRHHLRLSSVTWGEERLRSARRTLGLLPGCSIAHWLASTVHVARQALGEAERELVAGVAAQNDQTTTGQSRFSGVGLHWLLGLIHLARGEETQAIAAFERELSFETSGHLYARECCANTWYAIGALRLRQGRLSDAGDAFRRTVERVAMHPMARVAIAHRGAHNASDALEAAAPRAEHGDPATVSVDPTIMRAAQLVLAGAPADAARLVAQALADAPPGNTAWLIPVEPLLCINADPAIWAPVLSRLAARAA